MNIPIVNITASNPSAPQQLLQAAKDFGFVFIQNDGESVPPADIAQMFDLSRQFFAAPVEVKEEVSIGSST
jgi:isopenicillin N synthase-like dioxygenase